MNKKIVIRYFMIPMPIIAFIYCLVALYISTRDCALTYFLLELTESYSRIDVFSLVFVGLFTIYFFLLASLGREYDKVYHKMFFTLENISCNNSNKLYQIDREFKNDHEFTSTISMIADNYVLMCDVDGKELKVFKKGSDVELQYIYLNSGKKEISSSGARYLILSASGLYSILEKESDYISKCKFNYLCGVRNRRIKKKVNLTIDWEGKIKTLPNKSIY